MISLHKEQQRALTYFQNEFEREDFYRERQRAGVLAILFAFGCILYGIGIRLMNVSQIDGHEDVSSSIAIYMGGMLAYEFFIWRTLGVISKKIPGLPYFAKFGNAAFEVTVLTFTLYYISLTFDHPILILLSPIAYLYFLFITLSTLRLSIAVSLWTGALAGLEFYLLSLYLMEPQTAELTELTFYLNTTFPYIMKALIMLLTGGGAAFVAGQISKSIRLSIERMETSDQIRTLFGQQVSPEVVQVILEQNGALEASHRKVAILFLDIRNFTQYADTHTPEEVITYQSAFFGLVAVVVQRYGGIVNQFLGDGCMVTFGAPLVLANPAERAVEAGFSILDAISDANRTGVIPPTEVGIGIHTGDAVVGNIGTETRQQYNISGTVVIQAARIEQLNKIYDSHMLISQQVIDELPSVPIDTKRVGAIHLKGITEDVVLWQLA